MSLLTTAQLTFCDLKDSYSIHVDTECIGLVCDNSGLVSEDQTATISYRAFAGSTVVGVSCEVFDLPHGVELDKNISSSGDQDGSIVFKITKGATLNYEVTSSVKIVFTTNDEDKFTFEKYITFIKSMAGHDGTDAVDFQIYSVDGFEFSDYLNSIELKTIALQGGQAISSGISYQWKWWNGEDDKYEIISDATSSTLTVNVTSNYAFTSLKCEMTHNGVVYEDYVSLTRQTSVYTAVVKFLNGSNIITSDDEYLIAYVELYKDNTMVESLQTNKVYVSDSNVLQSNIISTDLAGTYNDNDKMYFVCKNTQGAAVEYDVVLGQYVSGKWQLISSDYVYKNDLYDYTTSPIIFIPKTKISRSLDISFIIYNNDSIITRTNTMVLDFNDPIIGDEPSSKKKGMLWLDTSSGVLKVWDGAQWANSNYQKGSVVYTSQPDSYSKGDLWILASGEKLGDYGEGCMLRATNTSSSFNSSDWEDVDEEGTEQKNNIKQYFDFNKDTGLKIGQSNNKFYVNISSTRMSFCENPLINGSENDIADPNEVVSIGNKSATIKNLTVEDGAVFNCEVHFGKFVLKTESNGSLSLALTT
jgi:hypothetical protein